MSMRYTAGPVVLAITLVCACSDSGGGGAEASASGTGAEEGGAETLDAGETADVDTNGTGSGGQDGGGEDAGGDPPLRPDDYIRGDRFGKLAIEVDTAPGLEPRDGVSADVVAGLEGLFDKPDGIEVRLHDRNLPDADQGVWTAQALIELADETNDLPTDDNTIEIHTMWLSGEYEESSTLGVAWGNRHIAMFPETIDDFCTDILLVGTILCPLAETAVWTHEIGHVVGLVDNGVEMVQPHEDAAHPKHDDDEDCVMYWTYDGADAIDLLNERVLKGVMEAPTFDAACTADIEALRDAP